MAPGRPRRPVASANDRYESVVVSTRMNWPVGAVDSRSRDHNRASVPFTSELSTITESTTFIEPSSSDT